MFRSFFSTIFRGSSAVLRAVILPPADLRLYYYVVCGCMCMSSVRVWCSCQITNRQEHQTRTDDIHMRPVFIYKSTECEKQRIMKNIEMVTKIKPKMLMR
jgi:hypothetical protein